MLNICVLIISPLWVMFFKHFLVLDEVVSAVAGAASLVSGGGGCVCVVDAASSWLNSEGSLQH